MNHDEARPLLLDLAYGELDEATRIGVERHASGCPACREELDGLRATRALASRLPGPPPPRGRERLLEAARRSVDRSHGSRVGRGAWPWLASAAAVLLVAGLSFRLLEKAPPVPSEDAAPIRSRPAAAPAPAAPPPPARPPSLAASPELAPRSEPPGAAAPAHAPPPARPPAVAAGAEAAPPPASPATPAQPGRAASRSAESAAGATYGGAGLRQERRELTCRGERVVRVAHWTPGGWLARLTVWEGDLPPREAWYDESGRLRATRPALAPPGGPSLPVRAPTAEEIATSCEW